MIQNVIPIIGSQLNEYLKNSFGEIEDRVVVTSVANSSGASSIEIDNKIIPFNGERTVESLTDFCNKNMR